MLDIEAVAKEIVDSAITVHRMIGPGLLESSYLACLAFELGYRGLSVRSQVPMPLIYRGVKLDIGYRIDLLVEERIIIEVKAVSKMHAVYEAQLLSYLKLSGCRLGFLFNFHEIRLKDGMKRMINGFE